MTAGQLRPICTRRIPAIRPAGLLKRGVAGMGGLRPQASPPRASGAPSLGAPAPILSCGSLEDWLQPECDSYCGLRVSRAPTWGDIQHHIDQLESSGAFGPDESLQEVVHKTSIPRKNTELYLHTNDKMGIAASSIMWENLWNKLIGFKEHRIVMVGLDAAGKTTILYSLKLGEVVTTLPTIGFNVESVRYNNTEFTVWDVGGQDKIRRLWHHYYVGNQGIIFVIDSSDLNRIEEAREELHKLFQVDALRDAVLLVFANKQDLPNALSASELAQKLQLNSIPHSRKWYIQPCCATTRTGLYEGLDWLVKSIP